jgi:aminotransferase
MVIKISGDIGVSPVHNLINERVQKIQISKIREFSTMAAKYKDVISLTIGQPDFNTPAHVKTAGQLAIEENHTTYPPTAGYPDLRKAACNFVAEKYDQHYDFETETLVTNGATEAIYIALRTILDEKSEVILPVPIYSGYEPVIHLCGATPVYVDTRNTDFKLTASALKQAITDKTRCVILATPMNPTGVTLSSEELEAIRDVLVDKDIFVVSDEVYSELLYDGKHASIAQKSGMKDKTVVINGLSKSHAMTGWRVGFTFAPSWITEQMIKVNQYAITAVSSISQYAAIEALTNGMDDSIAMRDEYHRRRDYVYDRLQAMNLDVVRPNGAFYFFPSIAKYGKTSLQFALDLLENARVAVVPGDAFSEFGEGYVRLSYAYSMDKLEAGLDRFEAYLRKIQ